MSNRIILLLVVALLSAPASAGGAKFEAFGTVASVSGGATTFPGLASGQPAHVSYEVITPGSVRGLGTNYAVDTPTFTLTLGFNSVGADPGAVALMRDIPDGVNLSSAPLVGPYTLACEFTASGNIFNSADPLTNVGTWSGAFYSVFTFSVTGPGTFIDINLNSFSISIPQTGTPFCFGDGSGTACPCSNNSPPAAFAGCLNFNGTGGNLKGGGVASISADTLTMNCAGGIPFGPGLYFQGSTSAAPGIVFGNGLLCVGGTTPRLEIRFADSVGASSTTVLIHNLGATSAGDNRNYQLWYRDGASPFCTGAGYNLTNAVNLVWAP